MISALLALALLDRGDVAGEPEPIPLPGCGVCATHCLLRCAGKPVSLHELDQAFRSRHPPFDSTAVSAQQIQEVVTSYGLPSEVVRYQGPAPGQVRPPCILYFRAGRWPNAPSAQVGHFVTLVDRVGEESVVLDWSPTFGSPVRRVTDATLRRHWDGEAIVLRQDSRRWVGLAALATIVAAALASQRLTWRITAFCVPLLIGGCSCAPADRPMSETAIPTLAFAEPMAKLGVLSPAVSATHEFSFQVWNDGPVTIRAIDASCGCTVPDKRLIGTLLQPGSLHRLAVTVRPDGEAMNSTRTLRIRTEPQSPAPLVIAVNYARRDPPQLSVRHLRVVCRPDERAEGQVTITHRRREDQPAVALDLVRSRFGDFSVAEIKTESATVPRHAVLEGLLAVETTTVTLRANQVWPFGRRDGEMRLAFDDGTSQTLPTRIEVPHPIALSSDSLFVGVLKPGQVVQKKVHVRLAPELPASRLAARGSGVVSAEVAGAFLIATIRAPAETGRFSGEIVVTLNGLESLTRTVAVEGICAP